jgi:hypothetical protein
VLGRRRFTTNVERVLFALVADRVIRPASKLATVEWASCDVISSAASSTSTDELHERPYARHTRREPEGYQVTPALQL